MFESFRKNKKGILLMMISSICACVGQLLWKLSVIQGVVIMLLGFVFYGIGAIVMMIAYRYGKLSVLQPVLSMNYILSIILAAWILDENITWIKLVGAFIVIIGVTLITGGDEE